MIPQSGIAGMDEAGRGALAGPVVAAACIIPSPLFRRRSSSPRWSPFRRARENDCLVADSKLLTPKERDIAFEWITSHCLFGIGIVSHADIDARGILWATQTAMQRALVQVRRLQEPASLLVDGRDRFRFSIPHTSIIRGDQTEPTIAAASIIAKVTRDRLMIRSDPVFPGFGFAIHKGYGTEEHLSRIRDVGPCPIHRRYFLRSLLCEQQALSL
jgi:ribonuclease HII